MTCCCKNNARADVVNVPDGYPTVVVGMDVEPELSKIRTREDEFHREQWELAAWKAGNGESGT